ncbi:coiled-coil domain-containing protein 66 [Nematolebias whitei]|uniref:coiled-coil domain-containing protein 66 n=1 Tax=Nematolebias whitei TaxID=451745 RepID=UPI0018985FD5|nr:coiled-coil domain-containing protein 66 [Nematolebias whitei]
MNIGDGLLLKLENGKPKLIILNHAGVEKNPAKLLSVKPKAAKILSSRQPCCADKIQEQERAPRQVAGSHREVKFKVAGTSTSCGSNKTTTGGRNSSLTSSKTRHSIKAVTRGRDGVMSHKLSSTVGVQGVDGKAGPPLNAGSRGGGKTGLKHPLVGVDTELKDRLLCLTSEELQHILNTVNTPINGQNGPEEQAEQGYQTDPESVSSVNEEGREIREEDRGGGEERMVEGGSDAARSSREKESGLSRSLFSWLEERQSESRATVDAKKAQWKRELDEQVALKQQRSAPGRLQVEEYAESVLSVQSSVGHRDQPAAIRSSLRLGEVTPMEESLSIERKEEQRRCWLEELDRQREEAARRRKQEKLLKSQPEDHDRWAAHFDSLQRRRLAPTPAASAPPPGRLNGSERGDWDPSSSLSLAWEATSSCGAESVVGVRVDSTNGFPTRTSYLRTMTSLLDPAQLEERERRRIAQQEQQRAIEAQVEERRRQKEQEEAKRRREEEEEEKRVALEREKLQKQYELETLRKKQKEEAAHQAEPPEKNLGDGRSEETSEPSRESNLPVTGQSGGLENTNGSTSSYRDMAVQTATAQSSDVAVPPPPRPAAPPNSRSQAGRTGKENVRLPAGGDPYEPFSRTERSCRDKRRPDWNTHRPTRQFVPASKRYPVDLQRNRQENRLKRQAELLALQERTRQTRTEPPQNQEPRLCPNTQSSGSTRRVETGSRGVGDPTAVSSDRGRSPLIPAIKHKVQSQQDPSPSPVLEFVPYIRTDEVFSLNPLEPADTPPPQTPSGAPPESSASPPVSLRRDPLLHQELLRNTHAHTHTLRQQEILRGLAQLRQGLLQKQKELETDLNPLWSRHDDGQRVPSTKRNKT